jgi:hypothetical protein
VREKAGEDGGGALLKGCGREAAEGGMGGEGATQCREVVGAWPRPVGGAPTDRRPAASHAGGLALSELGSTGLSRVGPHR